MIDANSANQLPSQNQVIYLKDYQAPLFNIQSVDLQFDLIPERTLVTSKLRIKANTDQRVLILDGEQLDIVEVQLDDAVLTDKQYDYSNNQLTIENVPDEFSLRTIVAIEPEKNTQLSGLYQSSGNYCTQCEAEGFRRITFFLDRPDVLSIFNVKIIADQSDFPVLLSNGNPQESGELHDGKHYAVWNDPHPKPSYLFALIAGKLEKVSDQFTTFSGNEIELNIYAEPHNVDKCGYALESLIRSMKWDEEVYGREYDLSVYNVVAVDDFNMGAMENKGLNVFNSKYVLALPDTATDSDFEGIESVIGHEYFHNWSGNRVTCRDWFQLSLKEGFTVFRDQEFSADMSSRGVKRINDVNILRTHQFKEDAGPMAHPVRPASYEEINNFYTVTVYNKGAEVVRMLHSLLGPKQFRLGTDLYFDRHDGQAVTTDDFVKALEDANDRDFSQFKRWYVQAGTPTVKVTETYQDTIYKLDIEQSCPDTPDNVEKKSFHIPLAIRLLDEQGDEQLSETVLELTDAKQAFTFEGIKSRPVLSFLRGYSAPVKVEFEQSNEHLDCLIQHDDDPFARWEAMQKRILPELLNQYQNGQVLQQLSDSIVAVFKQILSNAESEDLAMLSSLLTLPSESYLSDFCMPIKPQLLREVRESFAHLLAQEFESQLLDLYQHNHRLEYVLNGEEVGKRSLKNTCLGYLARLNKQKYFDLALKQYQTATNMTDCFAALNVLVNSDFTDKDTVLNDFYTTWQENALVMDKWFSVQAMARQKDVFEKVQGLFSHSAFSMKNPNKVRSLLGAFAHNLAGFHQEDGSAYAFYADRILELDIINPQVAARMVGVFNQWKAFDSSYADLMVKELKRIESHSELSKDIREIVSKALKN